MIEQPRLANGRFATKDREIAAMKTILSSLVKVDQAARGRIIRWALSKYAPDEAPDV